MSLKWPLLFPSYNMLLFKVEMAHNSSGLAGVQLAGAWSLYSWRSSRHGEYQLQIQILASVAVH